MFLVFRHKVIILIAVTVSIFCGFPSASFADSPAKLKVVNITQIKNGINLYLEHSRSPSNYTLTQEKYPPRLVLDLYDSVVTFRKYQNIPIEIPVNQKGIIKIIIEERKDYTISDKDIVRVTVWLNRNFSYDDNVQYNGKYISLNIYPEPGKNQEEKAVEQPDQLSSSPQAAALEKYKQLESVVATEKLHRFAEKGKAELAQKESKERLEQMRADAKKRMESSGSLEKSYAQLKAETEISSIPTVKQQLEEKRIFGDIPMPSLLKPEIKGVTFSKDVQSAEDCINLAMKNYIPLRIAREQEALAKLRLHEARRAFYPQFLGEWKETHGRTVTEPYKGRSYGFQANQPLFTGGKLTATLRKEQLGELIAQGNLEKIKQEVIFNVKKSYYELILARNTVDLMSRLKAAQTKLLSEEEKEFKIESATPADYLNAQATYNNVCYQLAYAKRAQAMAQMSLEKAMFTENVKLKNLSYRIMRRKMNTTLEQCVDLAFQNRPELKIVDYTIRAAKYGEKIIKSEDFPNISLVGSYGKSGEAFSVRNLRLASQWSLMGEVKWFLGGNTLQTSLQKEKISPFKVTSTDTTTETNTFDTKFSFWDNLAHFSKLKEAEITRDQARRDQAEMRNKIKQETEDAYYSYKRFDSQLSLAVNEIGYRRKQLEIVKTKKLMNEASTADVMQAELQLAQANANMQQALAGINMSIASMNKAIGIVDHFK